VDNILPVFYQVPSSGIATLDEINRANAKLRVRSLSMTDNIAVKIV